MFTLHNFNLYAVDEDGQLVKLGTTASFTTWGAENCARKRVLHMTKVDRMLRNLRKHCDVIAQTYIADIDQ